MSKTTRIIIFSLISLIIILMITFSYWRGIFFSDEIGDSDVPRVSNRNTQPLTVYAEIVKYETLTDDFISIGSILPDEEVGLCFETSGKITSIFFQEGSKVTKGQILAKVNDEPLKAELKKLQSQIKLAEDRVARQHALLEKDAVSKEAYEQVVTDLDKLNADIDLVKARIAQTELRAPFDGVVGLRSVSEGQIVATTDQVATLTKISPLKVEFSINERQADDITEGTPLTFMIQNDTRQYNAKVYAVESRINTRTRTLTARALYPNTDGKVKPGRSCNIKMKLHEIKNAITAPSQAIIAEMGNAVAYVYRDGKAEMVRVTKGLRNEARVQLVDGLKIGDTLIISGALQLRSGMPVELIIN